jgi:hypothetical protein
MDILLHFVFLNFKFLITLKTLQILLCIFITSFLLEKRLCDFIRQAVCEISVSVHPSYVISHL